MAGPIYRRVIVKVSGEALMGPDSFGIHQPTLERIAAYLFAARALGIAIGVVVGGGNIFRGVKVSEQGIPRVTGDTMGMLATVMNALALETAIERAGAPARTMSALVMPGVCETYERPRALRHQCAVFDAPGFDVRVADFPAVEGLAVENLDEAFFCISSTNRCRRCECHHGTNQECFHSWRE